MNELTINELVEYLKFLSLVNSMKEEVVNINSEEFKDIVANTVIEFAQKYPDIILNSIYNQIIHDGKFNDNVDIEEIEKKVKKAIEELTE